MFSMTGMAPITFSRSFNLAAVISVAPTAAAPSIFMSVREPDGFGWIPPESNVTPLPTRAPVFAAPLTLYSRTTMRRSSAADADRQQRAESFAA